MIRVIGKMENTRRPLHVQQQNVFPSEKKIIERLRQNELTTVRVSSGPAK